MFKVSIGHRYEFTAIRTLLIDVTIYSVTSNQSAIVPKKLWPSLPPKWHNHDPVGSLFARSRKGNKYRFTTHKHMVFSDMHIRPTSVSPVRDRTYKATIRVWSQRYSNNLVKARTCKALMGQIHHFYKAWHRDNKGPKSPPWWRIDWRLRWLRRCAMVLRSLRTSPHKAVSVRKCHSVSHQQHGPNQPAQT
jgi:hypothetical protein